MHDLHVQNARCELHRDNKDTIHSCMLKTSFAKGKTQTRQGQTDLAANQHSRDWQIHC